MPSPPRLCEQCGQCGRCGRGLAAVPPGWTVLQGVLRPGRGVPCSVPAWVSVDSVDSMEGVAPLILVSGT